MGLIDNNEIIYKSSKSFFWASKFLSEEILQKVINIYSFCRIHDDLVDENMKYIDFPIGCFFGEIDLVCSSLDRIVDEDSSCASFDPDHWMFNKDKLK